MGINDTRSIISNTLVELSSSLKSGLDSSCWDAKEIAAKIFVVLASWTAVDKMGWTNLIKVDKKGSKCTHDIKRRRWRRRWWTSIDSRSRFGRSCNSMKIISVMRKSLVDGW